MVELNKQRVQESSGKIGLRGLVSDTDDQVFCCYLAEDFAYNVKVAFDDVRQRFGKKAMEASKQQNSNSRLEVEMMGAYDRLNQYFRRFFEGAGAERDEDHMPKFVVQPPTIAERAVGWAPQVGQSETILTIQGDYAYSQALMIGIEWSLSVFYMMLFAGVDMESKSPGIAAFVVFFVDLFLVRWFKRRTRLNLAKKAIIDEHFILE
jgi:hypothetical protein